MDRSNIDEQPQFDPLDAMLREEAPYIDDAGFTARLVEQLPVPRQRRSLRALIFVTVALIAAVLTYVLSGRGRFVDEVVARTAVTPLPLIYLVAIGIGLLVMSIGLMSAISKSRSVS